MKKIILAAALLLSAVIVRAATPITCSTCTAVNMVVTPTVKPSTSSTGGINMPSDGTVNISTHAVGRLEISSNTNSGSMIGKAKYFAETDGNKMFWRYTPGGNGSTTTIASMDPSSVTFYGTVAVGSMTVGNSLTGQVTISTNVVISSSTANLTPFPAGTGGTWGDILAFTLPKGTWLLFYHMNMSRNGATVSDVYFGFGTVSGNNGTTFNPDTAGVAGPTTSNDTVYELNCVPVTTTAPTIIYAKFRSGYTGGPPKANAYIRAIPLNQ